MSLSKEYYAGRPMDAGSSLTLNSSHVAGFLANGAGAITCTDFDGTVLVNAMPIVAGFNRIPLLFNSPQGNTILSTAAGTLLT